LVQNTLENECTQALKASEEENANTLEIVAKLMNVKDNLIKQVIHSLIYRKILLFKDLNIHSEDFVEAKVADVMNEMDDTEKDLGYIPTKARLEEIKLNSEGIYTEIEKKNRSSRKGYIRNESVENLYSLALSFFEMENIIKTNFKLSEEKKEKFTESNPVMETLRKKLEDVYKEKEELLEDIKHNENKMMGVEMNELHEKTLLIDKLRIQVDYLTKERDIAQGSYKTCNNALLKTKHELTNMTEAKKNLENWLQPKLKETKRYQKELGVELNKIRQDAELLPSMFRAEAQFRNQCKKDKEEAEIKMHEAIKTAEKLELEKKDLKHELERKERLALQAIAARSSMKDSLADSSKALRKTMDDMKLMEEDVKKAKEETEYYKKRYDDMFNSTSGLNKRIEELEQHKILLLEKIKESGDTTGLEYIIKTLKLENTKGND
jgi:chromosome segregation ATPase